MRFHVLFNRVVRVMIYVGNTTNVSSSFDELRRITMLIRLFPRPTNSDKRVPINRTTMRVRFLLRVIRRLNAMNVTRDMEQRMTRKATQPITILRTTLTIVKGLRTRVLLMRLYPHNESLLYHRNTHGRLLLSLMPRRSIRTMNRLVKLNTSRTKLRLIRNTMRLLHDRVPRLYKRRFLRLKVSNPSGNTKATSRILMRTKLTLIRTRKRTTNRTNMLRIVPSTRLVRNVTTLIRGKMRQKNRVIRIMINNSTSVLIIRLRHGKIFNLARTTITPIGTRSLRRVIHGHLLLLSQVFRVRRTIVSLKLLTSNPSRKRRTLTRNIGRRIRLLNIRTPLVLIRRNVVKHFFHVVVTHRLPIVLRRLLRSKTRKNGIIFFLYLIPSVANTINRLTMYRVLLNKSTNRLPATTTRLLRLTTIRNIRHLPPNVRFLRRYGNLKNNRRLLRFANRGTRDRAPTLNHILKNRNRDIRVRTIKNTIMNMRLLLRNLRHPRLLVLFR